MTNDLLENDLFTYSAREALINREEAIDRVDKNAEVSWKTDALIALDHVRRMQLTFTSHDVWRRLDEENIEKPHEESAMGAVFRQAARAQLIKKTGRYVPSQMAQCHRDVAEWTSQ